MSGFSKPWGDACPTSLNGEGSPSTHCSARLVVLLMVMCFGSMACQGTTGETFSSRAAFVKRIVVTGFEVAVPEEREADTVRNPLTGGIFRAEPVTGAVAEVMTAKLFEGLCAQHRWELVSPEQAKGVSGLLVQTTPRLESDPRALLQEVARRFEADAALSGQIYRWRERKGSAYAAARPASVGFDLVLVSADNGAVLWRGSYEKTQRSLSEDIFDYEIFFDSKGQWVTVEWLADKGLKGLLKGLEGGVGVQGKEGDGDAGHSGD